MVKRGRGRSGGGGRSGWGGVWVGAGVLGAGLVSPGLTPASIGSGWWVNAMRGDLVWEDRALKSNFPGFLREPGGESPGKKGINKMAEQRRGFNQTWLLFLLWLYSRKETYQTFGLQEPNDYDRLKSMDWSTDSFIDLLIGLTYRWVITICLPISLCLCIANRLYHSCQTEARGS